jgi:hypothetical protein
MPDSLRQDGGLDGRDRRLGFQAIGCHLAAGYQPERGW